MTPYGGSPLRAACICPWHSKDTEMNHRDTPVGNDPEPHAERKMWTTPQVSVLSMDETATNASTGADGNGPTTGS